MYIKKKITSVSQINQKTIHQKLIDNKNKINIDKKMPLFIYR